MIRFFAILFLLCVPCIAVADVMVVESPEANFSAPEYTIEEASVFVFNLEPGWKVDLQMAVYRNGLLVGTDYQAPGPEALCTVSISGEAGAYETHYYYYIWYTPLLVQRFPSSGLYVVEWDLTDEGSGGP